MWRTAYDGEDVSLFVKLNGPAAVITFDFYSPAEVERTGVYFAHLIESLSMTHIHVRAHWNHWYQTPEMLALASLTRPLKPALAFGPSMGGSGAIWHGANLGARRIVVGAPQVTINPECAPFDDRWVSESAKISFPARLPSLSNAHVYYDPHVALDAAHAAIMEAAGASLFKVAQAGHEPFMKLAEDKQIYGIVKAALQMTP